jgi:hypothetical protein
VIGIERGGDAFQWIVEKGGGDSNLVGEFKTLRGAEERLVSLVERPGAYSRVLRAWSGQPRHCLRGQPDEPRTYREEEITLAGASREV